MKATGKVTPARVAPNEPTIDTTLIIRLNAGKMAYRNKAKACVAGMNKMVTPWMTQRLFSGMFCIHPKNTALPRILMPMKMPV